MNLPAALLLSVLSGAIVGMVGTGVLWLIRRSSDLYRSLAFVFIMLPGLLVSLMVFVESMRFLGAPREAAGLLICTFGSAITGTVLYLRRRFGLFREVQIPTDGHHPGH